ncbi:NifU family protein [Lutibacter sp.]|uniref:NifU family protein n=1 Tax=Lutibacter sp. TaxID=1925666 RepID=UPI002737736C|nr:NifU family protein [Lutibacter sp.]MDP3311745.1 NifU family protein [Lutibacter sp.]
MGTISLNIENTKIATIIKFISNEILTSGSHQFNNIDEAIKSPLAQQLFYLPFVKRVYISTNFIAIERFDIVSWDDVQNEVKEQLELYLNSGKELIINEENTQKIPVEVYAEVTPNPSVLKFVANKKIVDYDFEFKNSASALLAPLAIELFKFPYVKELFISENYVSVTKDESVEWGEITVEIRSFIREYIANGKTIIDGAIPISKAINNDIENESFDEVSAQIISILDEYIRPAVASDGGNIMFQSYDSSSKTVKVILQGACSGCPSSTITLKNGIENMLKQLIPGKIDQVVAVNY